MTPIERFWALPVWPQYETTLVTEENLEVMRFAHGKNLRVGDSVQTTIPVKWKFTPAQDDDVFAAVDADGVVWSRGIGCRQRLVL